ncbi:MAG TPA: two-component regulator propeller domain-containing protein, partial [Pelobium sp.]|nr:two-component regulator propeller domain-containing protein [Pelobium sp.]
MKKLIFILCCLCSFQGKAQKVALGQWRTHLPYNNALSVAISANEIYCATTGGLFTVDIKSGEINKLSTIDGLADTNTKLVSYDTVTEQFLVAYQNSNLDLIKDQKIYNLPEIFDKTGLGDKSINAFTFDNAFAYLACGFGVVVYDLNKREVKDTYFISDNLAVLNVAIIGENIFANTANGVFESNLNNVFISGSNGWKKQDATQNYPAGFCTSLVSFNNKLYGLFSDGVYRFENNTWQLTQIFRPNVDRLKVSDNRLLTISSFRVISYDLQENIVKNLSNSTLFNSLNDVVLGSNELFYLADGEKGLVALQENTDINNLMPNGPNTPRVQELRFVDGKLFLAPGAISEIYAPAYYNDGFSVLENSEWKSYSDKNNSNFSGVRDIVTTAFDASAKISYLGSYVNGVLAFDATGDLKTYNHNNSSLQLTLNDPTNIRVNGLGLDSENKLWVTQYGVNKPLSVKTIDGQWTSYAFSSDLPDPFTTVTGLMIDGEDNKWMMLRNQGLLIFDGSKTRKLGFNVNNGGLPGTDVNALALDREGTVWIGTDAGVATVYNPADLFFGANVEIPNLVEGGFLKPLLTDQNINCIAIDGGNRKWIGTNNGVWLFNAEGTSQILYFNTENSPLLANEVLSIAIDGNTGEVFFGTTNGIISYKGDATEPVVKMDKIVIYP